VVKQTLAIVALAILLRVPFLNQPVQGDDVYYLYGAEHAQIDPLHPLNTDYMFLGDMVDMRGHPHGPVNPWILAILLAALGDIREVPFHLAYALFSVIAALSMWSLARRFCERPLIATLLFLAVPAFVVNGNSFEADLPFLAFWMASVALFIKAVDQKSIAALAGSAIAGALAGLTAYQAVLLTPILAVYLFERRRNFGEIRNGLEQRVEIDEHAAHETIREVAGKLRIFVDERAKTERVIVKCVDQTPH